MVLPRVKKKLTDLLPKSDKLTKKVGIGALMVAIGAFSSPLFISTAEADQTPTVSSQVGVQAAGKLVMQQSVEYKGIIGAHYSHMSHGSHGSHGSHSSHYSHYSSG